MCGPAACHCAVVACEGLVTFKAALLLQSYIDFEIAEGNRQNTRELYERLLSRTKHVKVCIAVCK